MMSNFEMGTRIWRDRFHNLRQWGAEVFYPREEPVTNQDGKRVLPSEVGVTALGRDFNTFNNPVEKIEPVRQTDVSQINILNRRERFTWRIPVSSSGRAVQPLMKHTL